MLSAFCLGGAAALAAEDDVFHDVSGLEQHPLAPDSVLIFYWHDCPICNSYAQEIDRLAKTYSHFSFYIVQVDPDLTAAAARKHARDFDLRPPVLLDGAHRLVHLAGATVTPEAVVFGRNKEVLYRGRIDNLYASLSQRRGAATEHDLSDALEAIQAGKPTTTNGPPAMGCLIQDR